MTAASGRLRIAGIVLLALYVAAGAVYSCLVPAVGRFPDEREYLALTDHLLHGPGFSMDGQHLTASRSPGYPFFLVTVEGAGGGIVAVRMLQFILTAGCVVLLSRLFAPADRDLAVLVLLALVCIYPLFFYTSATLYPQTVAAFLFVLATVLLLRPVGGWSGQVAAGLVYGFLILVVPTFLFTLGVALAVAWMLRFIRGPGAMVIAAVAAIVVMSWTARNYIEFHEFVPIASNSGNNFLIGNCENTVPTGGAGNVDRTHYQAEARALGLNEFQEDKYYRHAAVEWIEHNPGRASLLYLEKTLNFFNVYNQYAAESRAEVSPWRQVALGICYGVLLMLLVWRLVEMKRYPLSATEKFLLVVFVLSAFTSAIFFTRLRLRLPYDYLIVAVIGLHLVRRWRERWPLTKSI